jgi:hypothetical protein
MNIVPVANQSKDQEQGRNQQQPRCFGSVDRMAVMLVIVLGRVVGHVDILIRSQVLGVRSQALGGITRV